MALDIIVTRGAGDRRGEDIVDPLIGSSIPVAIQRGRNELDRQASAPQNVTAQCIFRQGLELGQLARFYDFDSGEIWNGKITGISHSQSGVDLTTTLVIERPSNFYLS